MANYNTASDVGQGESDAFVEEQEEKYKSGSDSSNISTDTPKDKESQKDTWSLYGSSSLKDKGFGDDQPSEADFAKTMSEYIRQRGYIANENWSSPLHIGGKVLEIDDTGVFVECLINKEKKIFQIRKFQKKLFKDLLESESFKEGDLVLIGIRIKSGSQRIDIIDAKGMSGIKKEDFEYSGDWEGIDESLAKPLPENW